MRPDGDLVVGISAFVIVILAIIGALLWNSLDARQADLKFSEQCQSKGKEIVYRTEAGGRAIVSECK